ncbi:hypothetical protein [Kribbella sp. NPDC049227]|uniref:hypothetical protein n=1 Tax=Kribbella sp. NPDC049227 TaxID=3364113 RepID=UPI0037248EF3
MCLDWLPDPDIDMVTGPRRAGGVEGDVGVGGMRLPGVRSRHKTVFSGDQELLIIRHEDFGPTAYAPLAARCASGAMRPGGTGLTAASRPRWA